LKIGKKFNNKIPLNVKQLYVNYDNKILNNLPNNIEKIYITFITKWKSDKNINININNLPFSIKEIVIQKEEYKKYF
jgi:hypothetical protein